MDGDSLSIYGRQGCFRDTCISAYARQWGAESGSCPALFLNMLDLDMPFVHHTTKFKYIRRMCGVSCTDCLSDSEVVDFYWCCLRRPFRPFVLIRKVDMWGQEVEFKMR